MRYNGEFEKAIEVFEKAEKNDPESHDFSYQKALTYEAAEDYGRAEEYYRESIESCPEKFITIRHFAEYFERRARNDPCDPDYYVYYDKAIEYMSTALEKCKGVGESAILLDLENFYCAIRDYEKAAEIKKRFEEKEDNDITGPIFVMDPTRTKMK